MDVQESIIYLVKCAAKCIVPEKNLIGSMDLEKVYDLAKKHKISCCIAVTLESAGYSDMTSSKVISNSMRRDAIFASSLQEVTNQLDNAGIWYVPLKGIILKEYYPKSFMREMADHDILIDASREEDVRHIMEKLGFTTLEYGGEVHDIYHKKPILNYEMHKSLFSSALPNLFEYYKETTDLSKPEDFYLYIVAHEYKHYSHSGTGLRSLLDVYLYLKKEKLDWEYVEKEAEKIGIANFEQRNRNLVNSLFGEGNQIDEEMLDYIIDSNAYGTLTHRVENAIKDNGGSRIQFILKRLSVPVSESDPKYRDYEVYYPFFYRYRVLLPLLPIYRILRSMVQGRFVAEWKELWRKLKKTDSE